MRRTIIALLLMAIFATIGVYAREFDSSPAMNLSIKVGAAISDFQVFQTADVEFNVMLGEIIGIGVEAGLEYGYLFSDSYLTAIALARIWWFYGGIGSYIKISNASLPANCEYIGIDHAEAGGNFPQVLKVGLSVPMFHIGSGMLGLNGFVVMHDMDNPQKPGSSWLTIDLPEIMPTFEVMYRIPLRK